MYPDFDSIKPNSTDGKTDYRMMSGLSLAYIGDAVYELMIRDHILSNSDARVKDLHKAAVYMVNADFQAKALDLIYDMLSEEEIAVYKRGRNANSSHTPKNKSEAVYHKATGFEALFGYLYFAGKYDRLHMFFDRIIASGQNGENKDEK